MDATTTSGTATTGGAAAQTETACNCQAKARVAQYLTAVMFVLFLIFLLKSIFR